MLSQPLNLYTDVMTHPLAIYHMYVHGDHSASSIKTTWDLRSEILSYLLVSMYVGNSYTHYIHETPPHSCLVVLFVMYTLLPSNHIIDKGEGGLEGGLSNPITLNKQQLFI